MDVGGKRHAGIGFHARCSQYEGFFWPGLDIVHLGCRKEIEKPSDFVRSSCPGQLWTRSRSSAKFITGDTVKLRQQEVYDSSPWLPAKRPNPPHTALLAAEAAFPASVFAPVEWVDIFEGS